MKLKENIKTWKKVFGNVKFLFLAILIAFVFYEINVLIANWKTLLAIYSLEGFFRGLQILITLSLGFGKTIVWHSYASLIFISISLGMLFSLIVYRTTTSIQSMGKKGAGFFATAGIFLGVLAPGCAACGMGILSTLGLSVVVVNFLPFKGLEISLLSIFLLVVSISKITDKISNGDSCSIDLKAPRDGLNHASSITFRQMKGGKNE